jgi:hypothetical protein
MRMRSRSSTASTAARRIEVDPLVAIEAALMFTVFLSVVSVSVLYRERLLGRLRDGRYEPVASAPGRFAFRSDYGLVEFDLDGGSVRIGLDGASRTIALAQVRGLHVETMEELASLSDEIIGGADVLGSLRDRIRWTNVVLQLDSGERVPLFGAGQLERREALGQRQLLRLREWMQRRGWVGNARLEAARAHARILDGVPSLRPRVA